MIKKIKGVVQNGSILIEIHREEGEVMLVPIMYLSNLLGIGPHDPIKIKEPTSAKVSSL